MSGARIGWTAALGALIAGSVAALAPATAIAAPAAAPPQAAELRDALDPNTAHADAPEPRPAPDEADLPELVRLAPDQEARARALEGELRCPVCRSQSIRQSRSFMAEDMRRKVRVMIAEGRSDQEIRDFFVDRYGTWVLLTPPRRGFNLAAYVIPSLAVLIGALGLAWAARRWSRVPARGRTPIPPASSRHLAQLERELKETE